MKLSNLNKRAMIDSSNKVQTFGMKLDAKMYSILTDKLYKDKKGAVIRELSCNALDSHIEAGKEDVPFTIKLPTLLDNTLYIRDFGIGIEPDKFVEVYTTLGQSTKEDTNSLIGAFGLGSKTPFTINDTYTIENFYDGKKYTYACFKDAGFPSVLLINEEETEEENGLKISIEVGTNDWYLFTNPLKKELMYFKTKPKVLGVDKIDWYEAPDLSKGWAIASKLDFSPKITVVMGNVGYSTGTFLVLEEDFTKKYRNHLNKIDITIEAELGEVDIPPSREGLELTKRTREFINSKVKLIVKSYERMLLDKIKSTTSIAEAVRVYKNNNFFDLKFDSYEHIQYNNNKSSFILDDLKNERYDFTKIITYDVKLKSPFIKITLYELILLNPTIYINDIGLQYKSTLLLNISDKDTREENGVYRNDKLVLSEEEDKAVFFTPSCKKDLIEQEVNSYKEVFDNLGIEYKLLSSVVVMPTKKVAKRVKRLPDQVFRVDTTSHEKMILTNGLMPQEGYYFKMVRKEKILDIKLKYYLEVSGNTPIYGLRSEAYKEASNIPNLKHISTLNLKVFNKIQEEYTARCNYELIQRLKNKVYGSSSAQINYNDLEEEYKVPELKEFEDWCHQQWEHFKNANRNSRIDVLHNFHIKEIGETITIPPNILKITTKMEDNYALLIEKVFGESYTRYMSSKLNIGEARKTLARMIKKDFEEN